MKNLQNLLSTKTVGVGGSTTVTPTQTLSEYIKSLSGLVAYYPLDEVSGNAINQAPDTLGTLDGTVSGATQGVAGQVGNAYSFDGVNDKVTTPLWSTNNNNFSMGILFKSNNYTEVRQCMISNGDGLNPSGRGVGITLSGNGTTDGSMYLLNHTIAWINLSFKVQDNNPHLLVLSRNSADLTKLYLDGVERYSGSPGLNVPNTNSFIGNDNNGTDGIFNGLLQHAFYVTRDLTASEALIMAQKAGLA